MADGTQEDDVVVELHDDDASTAAAPADPEIVELHEDGDDELPSHAVKLPDGRIKLPFLHGPYTLKFRKGSTGEVREEVFSEAILAPMSAADMIAIGRAGENATTTAISRSCGIPVPKLTAIFEKMDARDFMGLQETVNFFASSGPTTGRRGSPG